MQTILTQTGAPAAPILTASDVKTHSRIDGTSEDSLIEKYIAALTSYLDGKDGVLNRALITQSYRLVLDDFPVSSRDPINIPLPPLQQIDSITYIDANETEQTMAASKYIVRTDSEPGRVFPAYNESWPSVIDRVAAVTVNFTAGYGDNASDIPDSILHAAYLLIDQWYHQRSASTDKPLSAQPMGVKSLLSPFTVKCFGPFNPLIRPYS